MRITLEYTTPLYAEHCSSVSAELGDRDDLNINEVCYLVRMALIGAGFTEETVTKAIPYNDPRQSGPVAQTDYFKKSCKVL